jgi:hypothetical protein
MKKANYLRPYEILAAMRKAFPKWHIMMRPVTSGCWYENVFEVYTEAEQQNTYDVRRTCYDFLDGICPGMSSSIYVRILSEVSRPSDIPYDADKTCFIPTLHKSDAAWEYDNLANAGFTCTKDELLFFMDAHAGIFCKEAAGLGLYHMAMRARTARLYAVDTPDDTYDFRMEVPSGKNIHAPSNISMHMDVDKMWFEFKGADIFIQSIPLYIDEIRRLLTQKETKE